MTTARSLLKYGRLKTKTATTFTAITKQKIRDIRLMQAKL